MKKIWHRLFGKSLFRKGFLVIIDEDGVVHGGLDAPKIHLESLANEPGVGSGSGGTGTFTPDAFNQMITDKSSFSIPIDSGTRNAIQWVAAKDRILIGTTGGEWRLSGHSNKPLTPTNYEIKPQSVWGSNDIQPLVLHEAVLFVDFVGKKLREMIYDGNQERYTSPDLLKLAEHITRSGGITTTAYQRSPNSIIWATLKNGDLISCTYVREQDVIAWARHPLPLGSEAGTDIPSTNTVIPAGDEDYPALRTTTAQDDPQLPKVTAVNNFEDLENMANDLSGNYYLTGNIDASVTSESTYNSGNGWAGIGGINNSNPFTGTFDGQGFTISNLFVNRDYVLGNWGLFGQIDSPAKIANVTLSDVDMSGGRNYMGALVGWVKCTATTGILIQNCHSSGAIKSLGTTPLYNGGLIGWANGTDTDKIISIYDCSSSCTVNATTLGESTSSNGFGGLMGYASHSIISNSYATGDVTGAAAATNTGGLAGGFGDGSDPTTQVTYCYATGNVTGEDAAGGFVGFVNIDSGAYIRKCYSTGTVTSTDTVSNTNHGGFVGQATGEITDCYARGAVTMTGAGARTGGFAGTGGTLTNCYSIGLVTSDGTQIGGFYGSGATVTSSYWDTATSGQTAANDDATGKTTTLMKTQSTFVDWDFDTIWIMPNAVPWLNVTNSNNMGANSVAVIPGTNEDEVWITVARSVNGSLVRYVERMKPRNWGPDQEDAFFVDSGLTYDGVATNNFTGLEHLEGETVIILGDGAEFPSQVVTNGTLPENLDQTVSVAQIGLDSTYKLKPMRADEVTTQGTSKGSVKFTGEVVVSFFKTLNAKYSQTLPNGTTITREFKWRTTEPYGTPPALFTGDKKAPAIGGYSVDDPIEITGSGPFPCTVRAIILRDEITGR